MDEYIYNQKETIEISRVHNNENRLEIIIKHTEGKRDKGKQ